MAEEYTEEEVEVEEIPFGEEDEVYLDEPSSSDEESLIYDDEEPNLVETFMGSEYGEKWLKEASDKIKEDFDNAKEMSEEYRANRAEEWKIFSGKTDPSNPPYTGSSSAHVPILIENIVRLQFRTMSEIFGDWSNVFSVQLLSPEDREVADALTKHGNWQLREQIIDFKRQQARGLLTYFLNGDVTAHSYYDFEKRQNRHVILTSDEFFTPYVYCTTMPDYSDCPFVIKVLRYYRHNLEAMRGIWYGVDELLKNEPSGWEAGPETELREAESEVQGISVPDSNTTAPYVILQYEGWFTLPNRTRQRYIQAFVDYDSGNVLALTIHEENNWQDEERYNRQKAELNAYQSAVMAYDRMGQSKENANSALLGNPDISTEDRVTLESQLDAMALPPRPAPPAWFENPDEPPISPAPMRKDPIYMFSHGVCIEPLTGDKGLGLGRIVADFNKTANASIRQFIDAATISNCPEIWTTDIIEVERKAGRAPGKIIKVNNVSSDELSTHIREIQSPPANPQLIDVVRMMYDYGQSASQSPAVLSGAEGKSGETFRGIATRVEQATKQLSVAAGNYVDPFLKQILKNNARLNWVFGDEEEMIMINEGSSLVSPTPVRITRDMYKRNYKVAFRSDLKFTSEAARIQEADQIVSLAMQGPLSADMPFVYMAIKEALLARGKKELIPYLGPEPPPPQTPFGTPPPPPPGQGPPGPPQGPSPEGGQNV